MYLFRLIIPQPCLLPLLSSYNRLHFGNIWLKYLLITSQFHTVPRIHTVCSQKWKLKGLISEMGSTCRAWVFRNLKCRCIYNPDRFSLCLNTCNPKFYPLIEEISKNVCSFLWSQYFTNVYFLTFFNSILSTLVCQSMVAVFLEKNPKLLHFALFKSEGSCNGISVGAYFRHICRGKPPNWTVYSFPQQICAVMLWD